MPVAAKSICVLKLLVIAKFSVFFWPLVYLGFVFAVDGGSVTSANSLS